MKRKPSLTPLDVHIENLRKTVWFLSKIQPARNYRNLQTLEKVAAYISHKFSEAGLAVEMQPFQAENAHYTNVIGVYGEEKQERIIVGAHYDVCGDQPGADDNASAIAGLLEVARLIGQHGAASPYRFDFVAYSLEEPPFFLTEKMGSYIHAQMMSQQDVRVRGMICLEMIGYFSEEPHSQRYPIPLPKFISPTNGNFIGVLGRMKEKGLVATLEKYLGMTELPVKSLSVPASLASNFELSDHLNYWKFEYDAVMITDTAMYRNPHYHKKSDTMDTLNFRNMAEVVKGVTWALLHIK